MKLAPSSLNTSNHKMILSRNLSPNIYLSRKYHDSPKKGWKSQMKNNSLRSHLNNQTLTT